MRLEGMFNHVLIKKMLQNSVFKILSAANRIIPKSSRNILLYASNKGLSNNLIPMREALTQEGYKQKYKVICGIQNKKYIDMEEENIVYSTPVKSVLYYLVSKNVFYTNGQIPIKPAKNQNVVYLAHGVGGLKADAKALKIDVGYKNYFTNFLSPAPIYNSILAKDFDCDERDIFVCGEPVTDAFYKEDIVKYNFGNFKKVILWTPTFRQSDYLGYVDSSMNDLIPLYDDNDYDELNTELKKRGFLMIVKLHGGHNTSLLKKVKFSNLKIYTHDAFVKADYYLYDLLPQVDVLLADYSSVYNEFLLLNKPIRFVVPDFEEYSEKRGFIFDNAEEYMPGEFIKTKEELYCFFDDIDMGVDNYEEDRCKVRDILHKYQDGDNCERILKKFDITPN